MGDELRRYKVVDTDSNGAICVNVDSQSDIQFIAYSDMKRNPAFKLINR